MSISNISSMLTEYPYDVSGGGGQIRKGTASKASFAQQLQDTRTENESNAASEDSYTKYLKLKYGSGFIIQNVSNDQKSIDALGTGTSGTGNIIIASNILDQMANEPEKAAYYEGKIQYYLDSVPRYQAELSAMGHEIHSSGIVIHPDGTVTHYISGDLKPEVRAKIEAQVKAEQEEKAKRKKLYQERSAEAAEKWRLLMAQQNPKQMLAETAQNGINNIDNIYIVNQSQAVASAVPEYRNITGAFFSSLN